MDVGQTIILVLLHQTKTIISMILKTKETPQYFWGILIKVKEMSALEHF